MRRVWITAAFASIVLLSASCGSSDQVDPFAPSVIVISITGNGLKTQEVVTDELPYPVVIDPKLSEFDRLLESPRAGGGSTTEPTENTEKRIHRRAAESAEKTGGLSVAQ